jgi:hypothetical protein
MVKILKYITYYTYYSIIVSKHHERAFQKIWYQELCPGQKPRFTKSQHLKRGQWAIAKSHKLTTVRDWKHVLYSKLIVFCSYNDTSVYRTKREKFHNHCMQYIMCYSFLHGAVYVYIYAHT